MLGVVAWLRSVLDVDLARVSTSSARPAGPRASTEGARRLQLNAVASGAISSSVTRVGSTLSTSRSPRGGPVLGQKAQVIRRLRAARPDRSKAGGTVLIRTAVITSKSRSRPDQTEHLGDVVTVTVVPANANHLIEGGFRHRACCLQPTAPRARWPLRHGQPVGLSDLRNCSRWTGSRWS